MYQNSLAENQSSAADRYRGDLRRYDNPNSWLTWSDVFSGAESIGMMAPGTVATMLTGNPTFMLGSAGAATYGDSYNQGLDEGLSRANSMMFGVTQGTVEVAFEMRRVVRSKRSPWDELRRYCVIIH